MGVCWWCHWGWPKQIDEIYMRATRDLVSQGYSEDVLGFGPSHIVWSDENWEDDHIDFCLAEVVKERGSDDYTSDELDIIERSLRELRAVPGELRIEPPGYEEDDDHPEKYPPPVGWEMVKR